jgi:leucyl-tRNA synthetase
MSESYDPHVIEPKWQRIWEETRLYQLDLDAAERPFYNLMEFPYPSGEGLHVGHFYTYSGADTYGRFQRMRGYDVFQPMGWDAFGIQAENYALQIGENPARVIPRNVHRFREEQMKRMGAAFDWSREVNTSDPDYYRWTQWIFIQLYKGGLAYRAKAPVNWCPRCLTTLANEQVIAGLCERCDTPVEQRELTQWFLRITAYADRLLDYSKVDFSETTRRLQRHWIGRKEGAEVAFAVQGFGATQPDETITVFTTRADTLFGATFLVLAPEHPAVMQVARGEGRGAVQAYIEQVKRRSDMERLAGDRDKSGVFTGAYALNPVDGRPLPIYVADYVLMGFGTGAIFGTPAHDQRDWEFAQAHDLPIIPVIRSSNTEYPIPNAEHPIPNTQYPIAHEGAYEGDGVLINSGPYDGLSVEEAKRVIVADLEARGLAQPAVSYRLRDWLISRQRYWGPPIPIIYCDACGEQLVPEDDLPVPLPQTEHYRPLGTGQSPLASVPEFVNAACPRCGGPARRETDVSDTFLDSAWYYLRYVSSEFADRPWEAERVTKWLPVTMYVGGIEHSTMHHLYARFLWKALCDLGHIPQEQGDEPFARLRLHGLIIKDGAKMSKSRGNVVNPDEYVAQWGADVLRTYMLFMGPYEEGGDFRDAGIVGVRRFFNRLWEQVGRWASGQAGKSASAESRHGQQARRILHRTVKRVTEDIESLGFNTAIAALMEALNELRGLSLEKPVRQEAARTMALLIAPFAPHLAEELWERLGEPYSVHEQPWPEWDEAWVAEETITLVVQVNGKVRDRMQAPASIDDEAAQALALSSEAVQRHLDGRPPRQVIVVPGKLVNVVV